MEPASLPFKFADCFRVASVRRNVLRASSSFKVGPSSNSFRLSSSLRTPNTSWPRIRVGSQAAQQSDPNSHLLEIERRSHSQSSIASLSRWTRELLAPHVEIAASFASIFEGRDDSVRILKISSRHTGSTECFEGRLRHAGLQNISLVAWLVSWIEGRIDGGELKEDVPLCMPNLERVFIIVHVKWRRSAVRPERSRISSRHSSHC